MASTTKVFFILSTVVFMLALVSGVSMFNKLTLSIPTPNNDLQNYLQPHTVTAFTTGIRSIIVEENSHKFNNVYNNEIKSELNISEPNIKKDLTKSIYATPAILITTIKALEKTDLQKDATNLTPVLVAYADQIIIEFPKKIATNINMRRAIARVILSNQPFYEENLLATTAFNVKEQPYFYRKIVDQNNRSIRFPKQAYSYANFLVQNLAKDFSTQDNKFVLINIPLRQPSLQGKAQKYEVLVNKYSAKFGIRPSLIFAIIETESAFNPRAVSRANAVGLMQIIASRAGRDVYNLVFNKRGQPTKTDLFNADRNIKIGVAYLSLLKNHYLADIQNIKSKEMLMISAYNGGLTNALNVFGKTPQQAMARINRMHPNQVYNKLRFKHKFAETRNYLYKVLNADLRFKEQLIS